MKKLLSILVLFSFSCGGPDVKKEALKPEKEIVVGEKGKCDGNRMPPVNYRQETAYVSIEETNASDLAAQKAVTRLRDKICQGYRCGALEPKISIWNTARAASQVCAMAVVSAKDVDVFLNAPRSEMEKGFDKSGAQIVDLVKAKLKKDSARIAIASVTDLGIEGGARSSWLVDKFLASLGAAGADTVELSEEWSGRKTPAGVDGVVKGRVTRLHGQELMLEVVWRVQMADSTRVIKGVEFPELIGPVTDPSTAMTEIEEAGEVSIRFGKTRAGGGMCDGDETDIIIESEDTIHTRVVNLFGDGSEGLLIAGQKTPGKEAKTIAKATVVQTTDIPVERLVLFGAKKEKDLGRFANAPIPCRIPTETAKELSNNSGYPKGSKDYRASASYRILGKDICGRSAKKQNTDFSSLPSCW